MPRLTPKLKAALVALALCAAAALVWLGLRSRGARPGSLQPEVCEEWKGAETVNQGLGWDLTYGPVLRKVGVCPGDPFCEMLPNKPQPPVSKYLSELQGETLVSSILTELPDGHASIGSTFAARTKEHAYLWVYHPDQPSEVGKQSVPAADYDRVFDAMACWRQDVPPKNSFGLKGYLGFLSLYKEGRSRQMLITYGDLFEGNADPDVAKPGRYYKVMEPLRRYW